MDIQTRRAFSVDLASEADFRLGTAAVRPSTRQLLCGEARTTLEPRVMQVLVVLARASGEVVSRDALLMQCWDGVVVGENAINRVISLLRTAVNETCPGVFEIETIKKVGYRLVLHPESRTDNRAGPLAPESAGAEISRRAWLVSACGVAALAGSGYLVSRQLRQPPSLARDLYTRGQIAQRQSLPGQTEQAIAFFTEAVEIDPDFADAWGALALSYRHKLVDDPSAEPSTMRGLIEGAARRALALEPENADAVVARLLSRPTYGRWAEAEREFRATLSRFPDHWLLRGSLGRLMYDVGRWSAGLPLFAANVAHDPFLPVSAISLAQGLWALGRLQEAEQRYRHTLARWPKHERVWLATFDFLALSGQPGAAIAMAIDHAALPPALPPQIVESNIAWARALESGEARQIREATAMVSNRATLAPETIPYALPILAALGAGSTALDMVGRYVAEPPAGATARERQRAQWRNSAFLFSPALAALRADPRWRAGAAKAGLFDYWRQTATRPDAVIPAQK